MRVHKPTEKPKTVHIKRIMKRKKTEIREIKFMKLGQVQKEGWTYLIISGLDLLCSP